MSAQVPANHTRIPERAAQWLVAQLTRNQKEGTGLLGPRVTQHKSISAEQLVHILSHTHGISYLRLVELKDFCRVLEASFHYFLSLERNRSPGELASFQVNAKHLGRFLCAPKPTIVQRLLCCFYSDYPFLQVAQTEFINILVTYQHPERPVQTPQTASVPPGGLGVNPNVTTPPLLPYASLPAPCSTRPVPMLLPNANSATVSATKTMPISAPFIFGAARMSTPAAPGKTTTAHHAPTALRTAGMPQQNSAEAPPPAKMQRILAPSPPSPTSSHSTIQLEGETDEDRVERVPQNTEERLAVSSLQQMSFTDPKEILVSFRKLRRANHNKPPSIDDVMLDIITEREEAEEARKMDAARLLSEQARKEESKRRRDGLEREFRLSLERCVNLQWLTNPHDKRLYAASWILKDATIVATLSKVITAQVTPLKLALLQLLKFEKNAQKWYGNILPQSYFRQVVNERLIQAIVLDDDDRSAYHLSQQMQNENELLETGMYDLSKQMGGVPKLFRDAHDQYHLHVNSSKGEELCLSTTDASSPLIIDLVD